MSSLEYVTIDHLAAMVTSVGRGAFIVKADIKEAYRMVPIHPEDQRLLGIAWEGDTFVDARLPFGLRSAPKIFNAIADAAQWILTHRGVSLLVHYLDDYAFVGPSASSVQVEKALLQSTFQELGIPLEPT